jgi:hypothetical protein
MTIEIILSNPWFLINHYTENKLKCDTERGQIRCGSFPLHPYLLPVTRPRARPQSPTRTRSVGRRRLQAQLAGLLKSITGTKPSPRRRKTRGCVGKRGGMRKTGSSEAGRRVGVAREGDAPAPQRGRSSGRRQSSRRARPRDLVLLLRPPLYTPVLRLEGTRPSLPQISVELVAWKIDSATGKVDSTVGKLLGRGGRARQCRHSPGARALLPMHTRVCRPCAIRPSRRRAARFRSRLLDSGAVVLEEDASQRQRNSSMPPLSRSRAISVAPTRVRRRRRAVVVLLEMAVRGLGLTGRPELTR